MSDEIYLVGRGLTSEEICKIGIPREVQDAMLKQLYEFCTNTAQTNTKEEVDD